MKKTLEPWSALCTFNTWLNFRFKCQGPGVFLCRLTRLGFTMTGEGDLLFRIIQWDEELLQVAGKAPAGPLFQIEGTTDAVSQLHLLHCEQKPPALSDGLSAVHMSDEGMSIVQPLEINHTHVVVDVSHFSAFGLIIDLFRGILKIQRPISSQVLLFHRPTWTVDCQKVNVFLVPKSIPLEEVKSYQENAVYIEATSFCQLIENQNYSLKCPESTLVQPEKSLFDSSFGKVHHPNFEIRLHRSTKDGTVVVSDQKKTTVWSYCMKLSDSVTTSASRSASLSVQPPANEALLLAHGSGPDSGTQHRQVWRKNLPSMRTEFIERVSMPTLTILMDELLQKNVINDREYEHLKAKQPKSHAAAELIDMVVKKGERARTILNKALLERDPCLYAELNR